MKKTYLRWIALVLAVTAIACTTVFATRIYSTIQVVYDDIKILVDGKQIDPRDVKGNKVEPFIYNGTTYLPVRAVADAFGKEVGWNPETMTVTLGSQSFDYLKDLSYVDDELSEDADSGSFNLIKGNGIYIAVSKSYGTQNATHTIAYKLDGKYQQFVAKLSGQSDYIPAYVNIYGNGRELLYSVPAMWSGSSSLDVEVDITGQSILYIEVCVKDRYFDESGSVAFTEARLLK